MKLRLLCLLPLLATLATGCLGGKKDNVDPIPDGNFTGEFRLIHIHSNHTADTVKANINLSLSYNAGTYKVTGDTATVHAGSYGSVSEDLTNKVILFTDKTYSNTAPVTKTHLTGLYQYAYDGSAFQMVAYGPLDTLALQYDLKKVTTN
jgi:hypothetical protein